MNKKICLKSDGTNKTGEKIIEYLESLGGVNINNYMGRSEDFPYYFIEESSAIDCGMEIPTGYILIKLPKINQYSKVMLVSNDEVSWKKRVVFMEKCNKFIAWGAAETLEESEKVTSTTSWNYAKDIPEETVVELTLKDISEGKGVGVPTHLIRIKE